MYAATFTNQAKAIAATSDAIGAALPATVEDAYQRARRVTQAVTDIHAPEGALVVAVTAALDADRDPASDPDVQRAFMAAQLANRGIVQGVEAIVGGEMVVVFRDHADAILHTWGKPFTRAAATLAKCHQRIGSIPLGDTATIMAKGADIASVWAKATDAVRAINTIARGWVELAQLTGWAPVDRRYAVLRIADVTYPQWVDLELAEKPDAWAVQCAGLTLSLADGPEYVRRVEVIEDAFADEQRRLKERQRDAVKPLRASA